MRSVPILLVVIVIATRVGFIKPEYEPEDGFHKSPSSARAQHKLPSIFDFNKFKTLFNKHYKSILEELARQRLFLGRAFESFVSAVSYKHNRSNSYLAINHMSDWSLEEIRLIFPKPSKLFFGDTTEDFVSQEVADGNFPVAFIDDIEKKLEEVEANKDRPGYREIASELNETGRFKRNVDKRRSLPIESLMKAYKVDMETTQKKIRSNNPDYEAPELASTGALDQVEGDKKNSLSIDQAVKISLQSSNKFLNSMLTKTSGMFSKYLNVASTSDMASSKSDAVYIDHRTSNCLLQPRDQGACGLCWVFSTIAMYEWAYCKATGKRVAFSEQYVLDCGVRLDLKGCDGDVFSKVSDFVDDFGLELRSNYPYRGRQDECPYEPGTKKRKMGYLRIDDKGFKAVKLENFSKYLSKSPLVLNLKVNDDFVQYGGGVDDNNGCKEENMHAVLLTGSGREDGEEYYLFRNSFSTGWGETGYYKMNKKAAEKCINHKMAGYLNVNIKPESKHNVNNNYDVTPVDKRYREYLKLDPLILS